MPISRLIGPVTALCAALAAPPIVAETADPVSHFTLDNGMDVVVIEDHSAPVLQHMVWYRAGAADEPVGSTGVAHFLEHLLFKGTETMAPGELSATVAANGGQSNAFTSYDYTAYYQRVAADRLELMMRMESDRMRNLKLSEQDIATERDVILEERNQRIENDPRALFSEQMSAAQYLNHRYGAPVIGWRHEMEALDRDDALSFYRTYYAPNNAILVVAGDVTPEEVRDLADRYYGVLEPTPDFPDRFRSQEPPQTAARRLTFKDPRVAQPYFNRSYLAPERDSGDQEKAAALLLLAQILGGGTTSYLADKLQFEDQIAIHAGAYYSGTRLDATTFDFIVIPEDGVSLEEAEAAMDEAIAEFMETGVDPEQLERIKTQARASEIYAGDSLGQLADRYGRALTSGLTVDDVKAWPEVIQAVTAEDIMAVAKEVLRPEASVTGYLMRPDAPAETEEVTQ